MAYPNIAELKIDRKSLDFSEERADRRKMDDKTAFVEYYKSRYGSEPQEDLVNAFLTIMQEDE